MQYIVEWRVIYCEKKCCKTKDKWDVFSCLNVQRVRLSKFIFMKKIFLFVKKNISLRENKYLCSRKDFDFGKLLRTNEMVFSSYNTKK